MQSIKDHGHLFTFHSTIHRSDVTYLYPLRNLGTSDAWEYIPSVLRITQLTMQHNILEDQNPQLHNSKLAFSIFKYFLHYLF